MSRGQAFVLILEQLMMLVLLGWFGLRFGKWTASRHKLTDSTNALVHELQMHRIGNHIANFTYDDREENVS